MIGRAGLLATLALLGCSYDEDKALRAYDAELEPVRALAMDIARAQPRLSERRSAGRLREEIEIVFLPQVRRLQDVLAGMDPKTEAVRVLHEELLGLWRQYYETFEELAEDLTVRSMPEKIARLSTALERLTGRWRAWTLDVQAVDDRVTGWGT